jgi:hypothetical protein
VKIFSQHPHRADIGLLRPVGLPLQLQVFNETVSQSGHSISSMMNEVHTQDEYIMEEDDTCSDHGKRKMVGRSTKLFCRPAALFNAAHNAPERAGATKPVIHHRFFRSPFSLRCKPLLETYSPFLHLSSLR